LKTFPLTRAVTPATDARALLQLYRWLRAEQFDLVEVATPKAALLGSVAARLARCRQIVHVLHGLPYEGKSGWLGASLRASAWVPCRLADVTWAVSPSVAQRVRVDGLAGRAEVRIMGAGSCNGVDLQRFSPDARGTGAAVRAAWNIPADATVVGFVGRLTCDKGVDELARAFEGVHRRRRDVVLLVVGDYEERDRPSAETIRRLAVHPAVRHVGFQTDVVGFLAAMDLFVLPTRREGLGNVLLEAAAMGLPTVTTRATGARDATVPGVTGLQVETGNVDGLEQAISSLVNDPALRRRMGVAGRRWVAEHFDRQRIWQLQADAYRQFARGARKRQQARP
jgi:glycosyltransferase involved in cell wall biosynthesis